MKLPDFVEAKFKINIEGSAKLWVFDKTQHTQDELIINAKLMPIFEAVSELKAVVEKYPQVFKSIEIEYE